MVPIITRSIGILTIVLFIAYFSGMFWPTKPGETVTRKGIEISMTCGGKGKQFEECLKGVREWEEKTGNKVNLVSVPTEANEKLALYQQFFAAKSKNLDIFLIDVAWPSLFANHLEDLSSVVPDEEKTSHFEHLIKNNTINGALIALPFYNEIGVLYYRKDLLEKHNFPIPQTWEELTNCALKIQEAERGGNSKKMWGYIFQGKAAEGLTVNGLEWIGSYGGDLILNDQGQVSINTSYAKKALELASSWIGKISPEGVLNYSEEDGRGVFQSGNAVFLRSWSYVWGLVNAADSQIKGKVGIVRLPKGGDNGKHVNALGGQQLAVSKYSMHKVEAMSLIRHLTSAKEQKRRALSSSYLPTLPALYQDSDVLAKHPHFAQIYPFFETAILRPTRQTGLKYSQVSKEFFMTVHEILARKGDKIDQRLESLQTKLSKTLAPITK